MQRTVPSRFPALRVICFLLLALPMISLRLLALPMIPFLLLALPMISLRLLILPMIFFRLLTLPMIPFHLLMLPMISFHLLCQQMIFPKHPVHRPVLPDFPLFPMRLSHLSEQNPVLPKQEFPPLPSSVLYCLRMAAFPSALPVPSAVPAALPPLLLLFSDFLLTGLPGSAPPAFLSGSLRSSAPAYFPFQGPLPPAYQPHFSEARRLP